MSNAAKTVVRALTRAQRRDPAPVEGEFAKAVARKLERRGIARVPGAEDDSPEPEWFDLAIEHQRRQRATQAELEARRQAEQEAELPTADMLRSALTRRTPGTPLPLNGAAVLRAALAGGQGTVNSS